MEELSPVIWAGREKRPFIAGSRSNIRSLLMMEFHFWRDERWFSVVQD
jgi:hypothetical protein